MTTMSQLPVPPHDRVAAEVLAAMGEWSAPEGLTIVDMLRAGSAAIPEPTDEELAGDEYTVSEHLLPSYDGAEVPVLVCSPRNVAGPTPVLFWVHGGGMVSGTHRGGVNELKVLARDHGAAIVSIGYRLAPEHPHPAPVEDCYAGLLWTLEHAGELGIDPDRVVVTGGSAGGGLAAALVLLYRDRLGRNPLAQLLMYPMLDDRDESPSTIQLAEWATWNRQANQAGWAALLGDDRGGPDVSPHAAPSRETNLTSLPPTFLEVGSTDLFRDEVVDYASRIWLAGGECELHVWPGGFHGYEVMAPHSGISRGTIATRRAWLDRILGAA